MPDKSGPTPIDRDQAANHFGYGSWGEMTYWASGNEHDEVERLAETLAENRMALEARHVDADWIKGVPLDGDTVDEIIVTAMNEFGPYNRSTPCEAKILAILTSIREHYAKLETQDFLANAALAWFDSDRQLELTYYSPVYGDDDDQSEEWRVTRQSGSINDREWTIIGRGATSLAAIIDARSQTIPTNSVLNQGTSLVEKLRVWYDVRHHTDTAISGTLHANTVLLGEAIDLLSEMTRER